MTLVEVLASLALLSLLAGALSGWCTWAARAQSEYAPRVNAEMAARSVLRLVGDDLLVGNPGAADRQDPQADRVATESGELRIHTRENGPVIHAYQLDPASNSLVRLSILPDGSSSSRLLIEAVQALDCTIDHDKHELTVTLRLTGGRPFTRSYQIQ
jgi:type II secretory pathway pseudopilin PulG